MSPPVWERQEKKDKDPINLTNGFMHERGGKEQGIFLLASFSYVQFTMGQLSSLNWQKGRQTSYSFCRHLFSASVLSRVCRLNETQFSSTKIKFGSERERLARTSLIYIHSARRGDRAPSFQDEKQMEGAWATSLFFFDISETVVCEIHTKNKDGSMT